MELIVILIIAFLIWRHYQKKKHKKSDASSSAGASQNVSQNATNENTDSSSSASGSQPDFMQNSPTDSSTENPSLIERADMYYEGNGVAQSRIDALALYEQVAEQGDSYAQWRCATIYDDGELVPADKDRALYWYAKAAKQGFRAARDMLVAKNTLVTMLKNHSEDEIKSTCVDAGLQFIHNHDYDGAIIVFIQGAILNDPEAQYSCGLSYLQVVENSDPRVALYWYEKAAKQGLIKAQKQCAQMYDEGVGASVNKDKCLFWYKQAADQGDAPSQLMYGTLYEQYKAPDPNLDAENEFRVSRAVLTESRKYVTMASENDDAEVREDALRMLKVLQNLEDAINE